MIKYSLFLLIASSFLLQATSSPDSPPSNCFTKKYAVYIVSHLPPNTPPLHVHCISKDDDLGYHNLTQNVEYRFAFCVKPLVTMFSCRFQWNGKDRGIHVFEASWGNNRCDSLSRDGICYYAVQPEGFYFTNVYPPPKKVGFLCDWNPKSKC
ncbi:hypothetical protein AAHA92_26511 [Salvia divinorum]|uniref:S-protein homolog n=1 Tax=Salvia divinorum TaxID=28513 RepID=A0ABD1GE63_SALDI